MSKLVIPELGFLEIDISLLKQKLREIRDEIWTIQKESMKNEGVYADELSWEFLGVDEPEDTELIYVMSWGIVHHRDITEYTANILIPLTTIGWEFKYTDTFGNEKSWQTDGCCSYTVFDHKELHSLSPKKSMRKPFVAAVIEFGKK